MADAEVGDDVYGEDPTVNRLQERVAELLGKEAALFVASGTMANQTAIAAQTRPGDDVLVGEGTHCYFYEGGAAGLLSGVQFTVVGQGGLYGPDDVAAAWKGEDFVHYAPTRLVVVENTHNRGGGRIWPPPQAAAVAAAARARGGAAHLDGARLWNVHVATGRPLAELAAPFDTVSVCLSKGLGCPVGSLVAGRRETLARVYRARKRLGGAMRQVGILAAAGLWALDHHVARLADDHANARLLAGRLSELPHVRCDPAPDSNIVLLDLEPPAPDAATFAARARAEGLLASVFGPRRIRLVTHLDVSRDDCAHAAAIAARLIGA
jgi:threonine aldolase